LVRSGKRASRGRSKKGLIPKKRGRGTATNETTTTSFVERCGKKRKPVYVFAYKIPRRLRRKNPKEEGKMPCNVWVRKGGGNSAGRNSHRGAGNGYLWGKRHSKKGKSSMDFTKVGWGEKEKVRTRGQARPD